MSEIKINSLGYVTNQVLMDMQYPATPFFERFLHFAIEGYREMNLVGLMPSVKVWKKDLNQSTRTIPLPKDYVDYLKIGVCCNGTFINFVYNDEICPYPNAIPDLCCGNTPQDITNDISRLCDAFGACNGDLGSCNPGTFGSVWAWPMYAGGYWDWAVINYGIGPGTYKGGYKINKEAGIIQFDSCVRAESVTMIYRSNGFDENGDALVPEGAIPALNAYIHYKRCRFSRDAMDRRDADRWKSEFITLMDDFNHRENGMTKEDYLDVIRRFTFQAVKA